MADRLSDSQPARIVIPKLVTDPVWALRVAPVWVDFNGKTLEIPAMSAAEWLEVLMVGENLQVEDIFPGLLDEDDQDTVEEALYENLLTVDELHDLATLCISAASGRPWWVTLRLIEVARNQWDVLGGELILKGVRADLMPLAAWLDVAMLTIVRNLDPSKVTMFLAQLESPPPNEEVEEQAMDVNQFMSMM